MLNKIIPLLIKTAAVIAGIFVAKQVGLIMPGARLLTGGGIRSAPPAEIPPHSGDVIPSVPGRVGRRPEGAPRQFHTPPGEVPP